VCNTPLLRVLLLFLAWNVPVVGDLLLFLVLSDANFTAVALLALGERAYNVLLSSNCVRWTFFDPLGCPFSL
jgi:hypothetical protein